MSKYAQGMIFSWGTLFFFFFFNFSVQKHFNFQEKKTKTKKLPKTPEIIVSKLRVIKLMCRLYSVQKFNRS